MAPITFVGGQAGVIVARRLDERTLRLSVITLGGGGRHPTPRLTTAREHRIPVDGRRGGVYGLTISLPVIEAVLPMRITGMNHAVLYVRDAQVTAAFYERVLGFRRIIDDPRFVFMRAAESKNHHDVAFFTVGSEAEPSAAGAGTVGLYHVAWEVLSLEDLVEARRKLEEAGAFVGSSDHGANKSLYAKDPDGLEFEVMWLVPAERWGDEEHDAIVRPLRLEDELRRDAELRQAATR